MFNPFKKKQQAREERGGGEQYFPPELERFRGGVMGEFTPELSTIPEKERKFKAFAREMENSAAENKPADDADRLDMILQKLETIDLRLKLIEQKLERRPI